MRRPAGGQLEEPYWIGTLMTWVLSHRDESALSCQAVRVLPSAVSASMAPPAGRARVTARPAGSAGSGRQDAVGPGRISAWSPVRTTAVAPLPPKEADTGWAPPRRSAGDRVHDSVL